MHSLRRFPLLLVCSMAACSSPPGHDAGTDAAEAETEDTGSEELVDAGLEIPSFDCNQDPFTEAFAREVVGTLARPEWRGRRFDEPGLVAATEWTARQFECIGLTPGVPGTALTAMRQPFTAPGQPDPMDPTFDYVHDPDRQWPFTNVIGSVPGRGDLADEIIVVGAHLDALGRIGADPEDIVPGANDDASGIAGVLAAARALRDDRGDGPRRTVVFAAWGVEENPFYRAGSEHFVASLDAATLDRIMYYVNFDMIGAYTGANKLYVLGAYPAVDGMHSEAAARAIAERLMPDHPDLVLDMTDEGSDSDFVSFCRRQIPYVFFYNLEQSRYHTPMDTVANVDFPNMVLTERFSTELIAGLADEPDLSVTRGEFVEAHANTVGSDGDWHDCSMSE